MLLKAIQMFEVSNCSILLKEKFVHERLHTEVTNFHDFFKDDYKSFPKLV